MQPARLQATTRRAEPFTKIADGNLFATSLLLLCYDAVGPEFLGDADNPPWGTETLSEVFRERYAAMPSADNLQRLGAAISIVTTDDMWHSPDAFAATANILSGEGHDPRMVDPPSTAECAWAAIEGVLIDGIPPQVDPKVLAFLEVTCKRDGYVTPPTALRALGVRGTAAAVQANWGDQPGIFGAAVQRGKDLDAAMNEEVSALLEQIQSLPLRNGKADLTGLSSLQQRK